MASRTGHTRTRDLQYSHASVGLAPLRLAPINLFLDRTSSDLCPVMDLLNYLVMHERQGLKYLFFNTAQ